MSASNNRIKEYDTVHHLTSRIAHRVYFLEEDERNDLIEFIRRAAEFCGIRLLGWCILTNHFHLLVHLPNLQRPEEEEVLRRYGVLKGAALRKIAEKRIADFRNRGDEKSVEAWLESQRGRMYKVGTFMKIVKQWFTSEYNRRHGHRGTLWEAVYFDRVVPNMVKDMSHVLAYINLNPIRAAVCPKYDGYIWSMFGALCKGDKVAVEGLRFVYDDWSSQIKTLVSRHTELMDELLESYKREKAEEIARRRENGYRMPLDPITNAAMIAQARAQIRRARKSLDEFDEIKRMETPLRRSGELVEQAVLMLLTTNPEASVGHIAERLSMAPSTVYERLRIMKRKGLIDRQSRTAPWKIIKQFTIKQV